MWTTLACLLLSGATPAQAPKLEIVNERATYGHLGAAVPKGNGRLAGDVGTFAFDIKNLSSDKNGRAAYSITVTVTDGRGNIVYREGPTNSVAQNCLGGNILPCAARMEIPLDTPAGDYGIKVEVEDRTNGSKAVFMGKGTVRQPDFGIVRVGTYADPALMHAVSPLGGVGETLYLGFSTVNFARDKKSGQPDVAVSLKVLDDKGQATVAPLTGEVKSEVPAELKVLPLRFGLTLNRPGTFTLELTATDRVAGKTDVIRLPIQAVRIGAGG